jgi:hypothetical protein
MNRVFLSTAIAVASHAAIAAEGPVDRALKIEFDELAAKATAAIDTVLALEQRARDNGESLHPNLIAQRLLVQSTMDGAGEALRANDSKALRDHLARVRAQIERLYRML